MPCSGISGSVYSDSNANGIKEGGEAGISGIEVSAYDANNTLYGPATSSASGDYFLTVPNGISVRIEFDNLPTGMYVSVNSSGTSAAAVTFTNTPACNVNLGLFSPASYCGSNPDIYVPCYVNGDPLQTAGIPTDQQAAGSVAVAKFPYTASGTSPAPQGVATAAQVGSVWGVAYRRQTNQWYAASFLKRHVGLGSGGLGAVYRNGTPWANVPNAGAIGARGLTGNMTTPSTDGEAFDLVGKVGLGDIDLNGDGTRLWVVNLNTRSLVELSSVTGSVTNTVAIPNLTCTAAAELRPFGLAYHNGSLYVGVVCSGETGSGELEAAVYRYNLSNGTFSTALTFPLTYQKGKIALVNVAPPLPAGTDMSYCDSWNAWTGQYNLFKNKTPGIAVCYPQPILSDIEFDDAGNMILGFMDRAGHQLGNQNNPPSGSGSLITGVSGGDILRANLSGSSFALTANGCAPANNQGPNGGEFYCEAGQGGEQETSMGGLAYLSGSNEVIHTAITPLGAYSGGVVWFNNTSGTQADAFQLYGNSPTYFGKAAGLGDLGIACSCAPMSVCSRIWADADADGIQDPNEVGIAGVTVNLTTSAGAMLVSKVTDADGNFCFFEDECAFSPGISYCLTLTAGQYSAADGLAIGSSSFGSLTPANMGSNDMIDSDATLAAGLPQACFTIQATDGCMIPISDIDFGFNNPCPDLTSMFAGEGCSGQVVTITINHSPNPGPIEVLYNQGSLLNCMNDLYQSNSTLYDNPSYNAEAINMSVTPTAGATSTTITFTFPANNTGVPIPYNIYAVFADSNAALPECKACTNTTVLIYPSPSVTVPDAETCNNGDLVVLSAAASGGTSPYTYQWYNGTTAIVGATSSNYSVPATAGTYTVVVTDAHGCTASDNGTVTLHPSPSVNVPNPAPVCEGNDVTLTGTASGGSAPYTYQWYNGGIAMAGQTSASLTVAEPTLGTYNYTLIVTDSEGCTATDEAVITVYCQPHVTLTPPEPVCQGSAVTIISTVFASSTDLSYQWYANGTAIAGATDIQLNIPNPPVGTTTYSLVVTEAQGCHDEDAVTLTVYPNPDVTIPTPDEVCQGSSVVVMATATNGNAPYTYQWYQGGAIVAGATSATYTINSPALGNTSYAVVVTDANGCSDSANTVVTVNPQPSVTINTPAPVCDGTSVTLTATASAGGSFSYQWYQAGTAISGAVNASYTITNVPSGNTTYSVVITSANGCSASNSTTVTEYDNPSVTVNDPPTVCDGSSATLTALPSGGSSPYTYQWYQGSTIIAGATSSTHTVSVITAGNSTYSVVITDAHGCTASDSGTITMNPGLNVSVPTPAPVCEGTSVTIGDANINGGTAPYTFQWYEGSTAIAGATSLVLNIPSPTLGTHTYTLMVTDANGCTGSDEVTITVYCQPHVTVPAHDPVCQGTPVTIISTVFASSTALSYQWYENGTPIAGATGIQLNISNPPVGTTTYTLVVTEAQGCNDEDEIVLTVYPNLDVTLNTPEAICLGGNVNLTATVANGQAPYSYQWYQGASAIAGATSNTYMATNPALGNTSYHVVVTDSNGCTGSEATIVTVVEQPTVTINDPDPVCEGSNVTLNAIASGSGFTYQWYQGGALIGGANSDSYTVNNPAVGNTSYSVVISTANGCSASDHTIVTVNPNPNVTVNDPEPICEGGNITLSATANGGETPYTYQWYMNAGAIAGANSSTYTTSPGMGNTTYSVIVTDSNGCTDEDQTTVTVNDQPTVTLNNPNPICAGGSVTLTASATGSGYTYQWYEGGALITSTSSNTYTVNNPAVGTTSYSVVISNDSGCTASDETTVTVYSNPTASINTPEPVCEGTSIILSATANGGASPYTYQWYVEGNSIAGATNASYNTTPNVGNTIYSVVVTDANGCTDSDATTVTVNPSLNLTINAPDPICEGSNLTLTGLVSGGSPAYIYQWYEGSTPIAGATNSTLVLNNPNVGNTVYMLTVEDENGCTDTETVTVTVYEQPVVEIIGTSQLCGTTCGEATLTANVSPITTNPAGASYQYLWNTGATTSSITVAPGSTSTYSVTVSIAGIDGCSASDSHTITISNINVNLPDQAICEGETVTLTPTVSNNTGAVSYQWSTSETTSSISVSPTTNMTYAVTVIDASGCKGFDNATVSVGHSATANAGSDIIICAGDVAIIGSAVSTAGVTYSWNTGEESTQISVSPASTTTYTLTATGECGASSDQVIVVVGTVNANAGNDQMICNGSTAILGASGGMVYTWSNGTVSQEVEVSPAITTTYTVTVTDANGCSDTDQTTVTVGDAVGLDDIGFAVNCGAGTTAECITINVLTTANGVSFQWNTGDFGPCISGAASISEYTVTVTDANGCTGSGTIANPCAEPQEIVEAVNDSATTPYNTPVTISVLVNDIGSNIFISSVNNPSNGTLTILGTQIQYTPNSGFSGTDTFTYQICNDAGQCDIATVTITVLPDSGEPCENISYYCTYPITPMTLCPTFCNLTGNNIVITNANTLYLCSVELQENECIQYIALPAFYGVDTILLYAQDELGNSDIATLVMTVGGCDTLGGVGPIEPPTSGGTGDVNGGSTGGNPDGVSPINPIFDDTVVPADGGRTPLTGTIGGGIIGGGGSEKTAKRLTANSLSIEALVPNPVASDFVSVYFTSPTKETVLSVYNLLGEETAQYKVVAQKGINVYRLPISKLTTGSYIVKLSNATNSVSAKLVKQ